MRTTLTTLKLSKKPDSDLVKATKAPVRRAETVKRDRSVAPAKTVMPVREEVQISPTESGLASGSPSRQRNHRFDGKLHGDDSETASPAKESVTRSFEPRQPEARNSSATTPERPQRPRPTQNPRANTNEPQYRQAPRRGGKMRDGYEPNESTHGRAAFAASKPVASDPEFPRLSKRMAELGLCSRREADEWIVNGWVKVDGEIIETLGTRINPDAEIIISSYAQEQQAETVTIILHKPVGYVSGQAEDGYQPAVVLIHPDNQWPDDPELHGYHPKQFQRGFLHGLAPAGRLDIDSTGMLVFTQDGRVARHLIGEDSSVEKEYLVRVEGNLTDANMKLLNFGLTLDDVKLKPAKVSWQNEDQLRFVLREGKKRQIRRMCEMVGLHVVGLKRIRIGSVNLGKLPVGQWRYLRNEEKF
jgi:23S rRNA pseudouridine2604 synthase